MSKDLALSRFTCRMLVAITMTTAAVLLVYFLGVVRYGLLILFASALFAVMLHGMAMLIYAHVPIAHGWALLIAVVIFCLILFGAFSLGGMRVAREAPQLSKQLTQSIDQIHQRLLQNDIGRQLLELAPGDQQDDSGHEDQDSDDTALGSELIGQLGSFTVISIGVVGDLFIIVVIGLYLAANPEFYIGAALKLVPVGKRSRIRTISATLGRALRRWLLGRFLSMVVVGVITTLGMIVIGVPLAIVLGFIAGVLTFIPYLGTILSVIPAILLAFLQTPLTALYVVLIYLAAHALEGYLLTPLIQHRAVNLAPAFLISVQLLGGLAAGIAGVMLATPFAVTLTVLVQELYVEDILKDSTHVLGASEQSP